MKNKWVIIVGAVVMTAAIVFAVVFFNKTNDLQLQLDRQTSLTVSLEEQAVELQSGIAELEADLSRVRDEAAKAAEEAAVKAAELTANAEELTAKAEELTAGISQLDADLSQAHDDAAKAAQEAAAKAEELTANVSKLEADLDQAKADAAKAAQEASAKTEELAAVATGLEAELSQAKADAALAAQEAAAKAEELTVRLVMLTELNQARINAVRSAEESAAKAEELAAAVAVLEAGFSRAQDDIIQKAQTEIKNKQQELDAAYAVLSKVNAELVLARGKLAAAEDDNTLITDLTENVAKLEAELTLARDAADKVAEEAAAKSQEMAAGLAKLEADLNQAQDAAGKAAQEAAAKAEELTAHAALLEAELEKLRESVAEHAEYFIIIDDVIPSAALNEGKALVVDITFEAGKLPPELSTAQGIYSDIINTLGFSLFTQKTDAQNYSGGSLKLGGQTALSASAYIQGDVLVIASELFGENAIAITRDDLRRFAQELSGQIPEFQGLSEADVAAMFQGYIDILFDGMPDMAIDFTELSESLNQFEADLYSLIAKHMRNVVVYDYVSDNEGTDPGILSTLITLEYRDIIGIWKGYGQIIEQNELFSSFFSGMLSGITAIDGLPADITFSDIWNSVMDELPDDAKITLNIVTDEYGQIVQIIMTVYQADEPAGEIAYGRLTENGVKRHKVSVASYYGGYKTQDGSFEIQQAMNDNELFLAFLVDDEEIFRITYYSEKKGDCLEAMRFRFIAPGVDFGVNYTAERAPQAELTHTALLWANEPLLTVHTNLHAADAFPVPAAEDALLVLSLDASDLQIFLMTLMENAATLLQEAVVMLPDSLQVLLETMF
ncbi:MAG: hypothetical protein FWF47_00650 [Clostridia bacterium]|nr:hypothetical protein [Clostridia bacterium]